MSITLQSADDVLKTYYLDVVAEQLNTGVNPFLSAIKHTTENVYGKEVRKLATYGINGGVGAGTEDGNLPRSTGNNYGQMVSTLKNLYGTIEISDKAVRASENNAGAFVNLINAEMEGLIKASTFNFSRMLFGDGTGMVGTVAEVVDNAIYFEDDLSYLAEGMLLDFYYSDETIISEVSGRRIEKIDRAAKKIILSGARVNDTILPVESFAVVNGSYNNELTGLKAIFNVGRSTLYGLNKSENPWLVPNITSNVGEITEQKLQKALDDIEQVSGSAPNFIICSWGVRRALQNLFASSNTRIETLNLAGGFTAMSYNGIPIVVDKFCPEGTLYMLNTNDFAIYELCDWQWLAGDDGKVLKQIPGKPVYSATLVKYAELLCSRPCGQGMLKGITEA